jgi:peroxiredoxin
VSVTPIAEQVRSMRAEHPVEAPSAFDLEQQQLDSFVPDHIIDVGQQLPDAELLDVNGAPTTLLAALGGRPAVLVFYRGAWCPFCNIALRAYQRELVPALSERGVGLIAVSPQKPDGSLTAAEKNELTYSVLSDPDNALATAAGILTNPSEQARAAQLNLGLDLAAINADGTTTLPMPTTTILDPGGTVLWIDVHPNYTTRSEPAEIIAALDTITQR